MVANDKFNANRRGGANGWKMDRFTPTRDLLRFSPFMVHVIDSGSIYERVIAENKLLCMGTS